jgi:hypothetical protein
MPDPRVINPGGQDDPQPAPVVVPSPDAGKGNGGAPNPEPAPRQEPQGRDPIVVNPGAQDPQPRPAARPGAGGDPTNSAFAQMRVENRRLAEELAQTQQQMQKVVGALRTIGGQPEDPNTGEDPEQAMLQRLAKDPIGVIKDVARGAYQEVSSQESFQRTLTDTRKAVVDKYPALRDPNSKEYQVYNQVCVENPEYFKLAKGPLFAMREMEERLAQDPNPNPNPAPRKPVNPNPPMGGPIMQPGGGAGPVGAPDLDAAQQAYCKKYGIDPKVYVQVVGKSDSRGGYTA